MGSPVAYAELIQKACWRERLTDRHKPLILHSDNGSPMKAATFLEKLYDLGITPSYSRPRVSNDNAFAESAFKTLKYRPGFPIDGFATLAEAQDWVQQFTEWYNHEHRHSALRYVTPSQRHDGEAKGILTQRREVFEAAKQRHPERWSGDIRKLDLPEIVHLNPERDPIPQAAGF
ncbi:transposase family protein [bacterium Scap17]|nr:transposase family protein [bacterium Scap17]